MNDTRDGKVYPLKQMPDDVYKIILTEQGKIKAEKRISQYSLEQTIYSIIREWKRCREEKPDQK